MLRPSPSCMRAAATTPAEPASALVARFPADGSLPRFTGGSASALPVSRPAQRSPKLRPACSLNRPWRPFSSQCFRRGRYPPSPAPTATGWSDSCRAGFAPAEGRRLRTAHGKVGLKVGALLAAAFSIVVCAWASGRRARSATKARSNPAATHRPERARAPAVPGVAVEARPPTARRIIGRRHKTPGQPARGRAAVTVGAGRGSRWRRQRFDSHERVAVDELAF